MITSRITKNRPGKNYPKKMNYRKYLFISVCLLTPIVFSCGNTSSFPVGKLNCSNAERINSLIQYILNEKGIYYDYDKNIPNYLIAEGVILPGIRFFGYDSLQVNTVYKDSVKQRNGNRIVFDDWKLNADTTAVEVDVNFFINSRSGISVTVDAEEGETLAKISSFYFVFDPKRCKWVLRDSRFEFNYKK